MTVLGVIHSGGAVIGPQAKLVASDGAAGDAFGHAVAISGDTAVVGAPGDDSSAGVDSGSVYIFKRSSNGSWSQRAKLTASDAMAGDSFGDSVAISVNSVIVGSPGDDIGSSADAGSAYVFTRSNGVWSQQAKLANPFEVADARFGDSVGISGEWAVIGAPNATREYGTEAGLAIVYGRAGGVWTDLIGLEASFEGPSPFDHFGASVGISGKKIIVGAPLNDNFGADAGIAYPFTREGVGVQMESFCCLSTLDTAAGDSLGWSVALTGATAVLGAYLHDEPARPDAGSAYVFTARSDGGWRWQAKLSADLTEGANFGFSVAVSGRRVVVGAPGGTGGAYVFRNVDEVWSLTKKLQTEDSDTRFGYSVAISKTTVLVGAPNHDTSVAATAGTAYAFVL